MGDNNYVIYDKEYVKDADKLDDPASQILEVDDFDQLPDDAVIFDYLYDQRPQRQLNDEYSRLDIRSNSTFP